MLWINLAGAAIIALIVWWFWIYKSASVAMQDGAIEILVKDGVYQPSKIRLPANQKATLTFTRLDSSPCSESLQIPDLDISESLTLNKKVNVTIPPTEPGQHAFHCQMKMYVGELIIE